MIAVTSLAISSRGVSGGRIPSIVCLRFALAFTGALFALIGLLAITLGYVQPSNVNAQFALTNCTYLAYEIDNATTCYFTYGKGQHGSYTCIPYGVETWVGAFGIYWIRRSSGDLTGIASHLASSYPINATVACYFSSTNGIRYQLEDAQTGLIIGIVFLSLFGATLLASPIAEFVNWKTGG